MSKQPYYVCEFSFNPIIPDKEDRDICLHELDFYSWGGDRCIAGHRLSLRKRISTSEYELYRSYFQPLRVSGAKESVVCHDKDLQVVLDAGEQEWLNIFRSECSPHRVCKHHFPEQAVMCRALPQDSAEKAHKVTSGAFLRELGMSPIPTGEIVYRGVMEAGYRICGPLPVWKCGGGQVVKLDPAPSQKVWNHSPDGFQWGYGGSGPAQLALALLLDITGDKELSVRLHQQFKAEFVAKWQDSWEITQTEIRKWIENHTVGAGQP